MCRIYALVACLSAVLLVPSLCGCSDSSYVSPEVLAQHRQLILMPEEPDGVQGVLDVREELLGHEEEHIHEHDDHGHEDHEHDELGHDIDDHEEEDHEESNDTHEHLEHGEEEDPHDHHEHEEHEHEGLGHDVNAHEEDDHEAEHDDHEHNLSKVALPTKAVEVVVVGRIGGLTNPWKSTQPDFPFEKNKAKFFLADPGAVAGAEASGHSHAPGEECPICAAHAKDTTEMLAVVQFVDKKGNVLPIDCRKLFDVKVKDTVVVRGKARVTAGGILSLDATGIYVRR